MEERRAREAEFRRELADMDSVAQATALTMLCRKQLLRWVITALLICPIMVAAHWPSGLVATGLFAWRIYRLISRRKAEAEKKRLIAEFVPQLNEFRLLLVQFPLDVFSEDMRTGLERRIAGLYRLMHRFGAQDNGLNPAEVVATYQFMAEGFLAMKPKTVQHLFCAELPRLILTEADGLDVLTPERFRALIDDAHEVLAGEYEAGLLVQGRIILGMSSRSPACAISLPACRSHLIRLTGTASDIPISWANPIQGNRTTWRMLICRLSTRAWAR
jgi:hypothetical protein